MHARPRCLESGGRRPLPPRQLATRQSVQKIALILLVHVNIILRKSSRSEIFLVLYGYFQRWQNRYIR